MSMRTNRKTKGIFRVGNPSGMGMTEYGRGMKSVKGYKLIAEKAERIDKIEYAGAPYVEDGDSARYIVTMGDGRKQEVEFYDFLDQYGGEMDDENEGKEIRMIQVVWDGAVDYDDSYDADSRRDVARAKKDLIARYGKLARAFLQ